MRSNRLLGGWFLLAWIAAVWGVRADLTNEITALTVSNFTGFVVDSDALNGNAGYTRDRIDVQAKVRFGKKVSAGTGYHYLYRLDFQLLDSTGAAVVFDPDSGSNTNRWMIEEDVDLTAGATSVERTFNVRLKPAGRLSPYETYAVRLVLARKAVPGVLPYLGTGEERTDIARRYLHFDSLISGDADLNVIPILDDPATDSTAYFQTYLLATDVEKDRFSVHAKGIVYRYDAFAGARAATAVKLRYSVELRDAATDQVIPLQNASADFEELVFNYNDPLNAASPRRPASHAFNRVVGFRPANGVQLDPRNKLYRARVTVGYFPTPQSALPVAGNSVTLAPQRFLQFKGDLMFGNIATIVLGISNDPAPGALVADGIRSTLAVEPTAGVVAAEPDYTFGGGPPLNVVLMTNGVARLESGEVPANNADPQPETVAGVRYTIRNVVLSPTGAKADVCAILPTGLGWAADTSTRLLESEVCFEDAPLNVAFKPSSAELGRKGPGWFVEESKPIWFEASSTTWKLATGQFEILPAGGVQYVRKPEFDALTLAQTEDAGMRAKPGNDQYWRAIHGLDGNVVVKTGANGEARLSTTAQFSGGSIYRTHFPYNALVVWSGAGTARISDDLIVPSDSTVSLVAQVTVDYDRDCQGDGCGPAAGTENLTFNPLGSSLRFTRDGGLQAVGQLAAPARLHWGYIQSMDKYAQETDPFQAANLHIPGVFLRGGQSAAPVGQQASDLLLTGVSPSVDDAIERSADAGYDTGLGDYAGLNFRVGANGAKKAESVLGGKPSGPWDLTGRSKYYVRRAGVTGIHEAVNGTFPAELEIYGYKVTFSTYGLAYVDSQPVDSRVDGSVAVPYPSNFTIKFDDLMFNCLGAPTVPEISAAEQAVAKKLEYWQADFFAKAMEFDRKAADACDPTGGFLLVGLETRSPTFDAPLTGSLAFFNNGTIISRKDNRLDPPYDGRLKMPTELVFKGPKTKNEQGDEVQEEYPLTPVNDGYLNNWADNVAGLGFLNVAGKLGVPFFEDVQVHLHTGMKKPQGDESPPLVHLMGGWPGKGFGTADANFFTQSPFDEANRGYPTGTIVDEYRAGLGDKDEKWRPRSRQKWLGVVNFDYAMKWDAASKTFKGIQPTTDNFLVIKTSHELLRLTARHAELKLGAQFLGLESLNLANLAVTGLEGLEDMFVDILEPKIVTAGTAAMTEILDANMRAVFAPSFDGPVGASVDQLIAELKTLYNPATKQFTGDLAPTLDKWLVSKPDTSVLERFRDFAHYDNGTPAFFSKLSGGIKKATNAVGQARKALKGKNADYFADIAELAKRSLEKKNKKSADKLAATMEKLAERIKDRSQEIDRLFDNVGTILELADQGLGPGGEVANELDKAFKDAEADLTLIATKLKTELGSELAKYQGGLDNPFADEAALKHILLEKIEDRFFAGTAASLVQRILKERFYDVDAELRAGFDSLFDTVNSMVREALVDAMPALDTGLTDFLGDAGETLSGSKIDGYAHIKGDSLTEARVNIHLALKFADQMKFDGFVRIRELDSDNTAAGCLPPGGLATEVTAGAEDVKVEWIAKDAAVTFKGKFVFDGTEGKLLGMGSGIDLTGAIKFKGFSIEELGASMMIGKLESYFSAKVAMKIGKGWKAGGGIMFGKTCSLDPFFWDAGVQDVLGEPPFTGAYGYGEANVPISQLLGLGNTCLIRFGGGLGIGAGFFKEGPTVVGKFHAEVSGEAICIIHLGAEMTLVVAATPDGGKFVGDFKASASLGWCPVCIEKTVTKHVEKKFED